MNWRDAPKRTEWGPGIVVADIALDKDHTMQMYCERDQINKVVRYDLGSGDYTAIVTISSAKCDGNHGGPRCGDPECWNDSPPRLTDAQIDAIVDESGWPQVLLSHFVRAKLRVMARAVEHIVREGK